MLTDTQMEELARKMSIPLVDCLFKDQMPKKFEFNKSWFALDVPSSE